MAPATCPTTTTTTAETMTTPCYRWAEGAQACAEARLEETIAAYNAADLGRQLHLLADLRQRWERDLDTLVALMMLAQHQRCIDTLESCLQLQRAA